MMLPYLDFKNGYVNIKLKLLILTYKSLLTLIKIDLACLLTKYLMNASEINLKKWIYEVI